MNFATSVSELPVLNYDILHIGFPLVKIEYVNYLLHARINA
jgi:hypothetical protein